MKLNQGLARRSAPCWVLGLLVTAAMFILPSAAGLSLAQEGEDPPGDKAANTTPKPSAEWKPVVAQSMPLASISSPWIPDQVVDTLDAKEAVAYFQQEQGMSPMQAATALASHLRGYAQGATVIVKDGEAIVQGQQEQIDATKRELERIREHGLSTQIRVDATVSHIPQAMFEQISANWQMMPRKSPELPVLSALVSREFEAQLAALFLQHSSAEKLSEPKIMTLNGRSVEIANGTEHPFVVVPASANDRKGEVQFEMDGFNLEVCPVLAGRVMELDVRFVNSRIEGVQQFTFESVGDAERKTVQVPQVAEQRLECKVTVPLHQILLFAIPDPNKEGQFTLLSLNPTPVGNPKELDVKVQPALEPAIASSFPPQTYGINPAYTLASSPAIEPLQSSDVVRRPSPPNPQYSGYPAVGELQPLPTPADATVAWAQTATPYAALQTGAVSQEYWFFKCDGPPVAEEIQQRCNEVFEAFHIRPSLEGSWELDDAADSIVLKGQNFALSCPGGDLFRFDCPSGQMNVHPASKRFEIVADDSCDVQATIDTKFLVEAKRIAFTDEGMDATGTKFKLMIETTDGQKELQGTAESLQHDGDGIRLTQAEILVDDIKAQASEVVLMDTKLLFNGEAQLVRPQESGQPMHLQADCLDLDLNTDRVSIGEQ